VDDHDQTHAKFYRDLVNRGLGEGYAAVAALTSDEEIVATVLKWTPDLGPRIAEVKV
jgi:hypothetical protein